VEVTVKKLRKSAIIYIFHIAVCSSLIVGVASVAKCWRQNAKISLLRGAVFSQSNLHQVWYYYTERILVYEHMCFQFIIRLISVFIFIFVIFCIMYLVHLSVNIVRLYVFLLFTAC